MLKRKLSIEALALKLSRSRKKHHRAIEKHLNSYVNQPECGCLLRWEWIWAQGDWILPVDVAVAPRSKKRCPSHKGNYFDTELFEDHLREVLKTIRKAAKLGPQ